ncbi:hypothetical protein LBMAG42_25210 [Deltaproteobacteria bacterium]|nr:hypothetical protein LBMAG42_25210 [Deltaproteobacteria bacterium]
MRRVRGVKSLVHNAVDRTVDLVEAGHDSTARAVMRVLERSGPLAAPARRADGVRRAFTAAILGTVKGVNHLVEQATDVGLDVFAPTGTGREAPLPLRSDVMNTPAWFADAAVGAANGVVGDHLAYTQNGLGLGMALRGLDTWIELDGGGVPVNAGPRIVVLVHGLATTEWSWCLDAAVLHGDPASNFGTLLQADLGYTPVFARYNTGRHVSESGRSLSARLEALVTNWPVAVEEIVLLGHSMGGLVARSACHIAGLEGKSWVTRVQRVVMLGSPLQGAALEKFGNLAGAAFSAVDLPATVIIGQLINGRSAGIKDLRYGYVQDAEWAGRDADAFAQDQRLDVELPAHISWCFISGTVASSPNHPVSQALGDLLVRVESASGPRDAPPIVTTHHVGGVHHGAVQVHPAVYALVRQFLGASCPR